MKIVHEAQQADCVLTKYFNLPKAELTHRGMQVSPQGILDKVMDGKQLMMVPRELCQKILVENHDGSTEQWASSNGIIRDMVSGGMLWPRCGHVRYVNK